ncbi:MAG: CbtB domain-containing protein [Alphaproteobacteria bacterium]
MTTQTSTHSLSLSASKSVLLPCILAAFIGIAMISVAGHVQAGALHDAAHDVRHATGFPCH